MSSTLLLPPRAQLCNRSCSNKTHTHPLVPHLESVVKASVRRRPGPRPHDTAARREDGPLIRTGASVDLARSRTLLHASRGARQPSQTSSRVAGAASLWKGGGGPNASSPVCWREGEIGIGAGEHDVRGVLRRLRAATHRTVLRGVRPRLRGDRRSAACQLSFDNLAAGRLFFDSRSAADGRRSAGGRLFFDSQSAAGGR